MGGLLSGLDKLGLGKLEGMDLFEDSKASEQKAVKKEPPKVKEMDFLFDKTTTCPICDKEFKEKTVKVGKAKLLKTDLDLRPVYEGIDVIKYDVISCPACGYTALSRYFPTVMPSQAKAIAENISKAYHSDFKAEEVESYDYARALNRYKLCLANAIVKKAKSSEKAYICLKAAWLLRGMEEHLEETDADYNEKLEDYADQEREFLKNALEGFVTARQSEGFPMCGMDESTVDYLIAVLAMRFEKYEIASKMVAGILTSISANSRTKDKARDLKEILQEKIRESRA